MFNVLHFNTHIDWNSIYDSIEYSMFNSEEVYKPVSFADQFTTRVKVDSLPKQKIQKKKRIFKVMILYCV